MPFAMSTTGVPCMPTGSCGPQFTSLLRAGAPTLVVHCTAPVPASSEYTLLATVATMTREPTTSGSAFMSSANALLSRWIELHCGASPLKAGEAVAVPPGVGFRCKEGRTGVRALAVGGPRGDVPDLGVDAAGAGLLWTARRLFSEPPP